jgi:hypothetical protein
MICPVSVCHQVSTTGAELPPMCSRYQSHASGLIGLADRAEHAQRGQVVLRRPRLALLHERPDRRRAQYRIETL